VRMGACASHRARTAARGRRGGGGRAVRYVAAGGRPQHEAMPARAVVVASVVPRKRRGQPHVH
jgi:hypothetical protein